MSRVGAFYAGGLKSAPLVEPLQQGVERLVLTAHEHGQALRVVAGSDDTLADGFELAERDLQTSALAASVRHE